MIDENIDQTMDEGSRQSPLILVDSSLRYGVHVGKEQTLYQSLQRFVLMPLFSFQIFLCSPRGGGVVKFDSRDVEKTRKLIDDNEKYLVIHSPYTMNLCGAVNPDDPDLKAKANKYVLSLIDQLDVAVALGDRGVVVHFGSCNDTKIGRKRMIKYCVEALTRKGKLTETVSSFLKVSNEELFSRRRIVLENAAGEKNKVDKSLKDIAYIVKGITKRTSIKNVSVCIDTQHCFASGMVDFGSPKDQARFFAEFDELIGLERLELFHLNDSKVESKERKDRHACLGEGFLFHGEKRMEGLQTLLMFAMERRLPVICETASGIHDREVICSLLPIEQEIH